MNSSRIWISKKQSRTTLTGLIGILFLCFVYFVCFPDDDSIIEYQVGTSGIYTRLHHSRKRDAEDTFKAYTGRSVCGFSSNDLHVPFEPLCKDRASLLQSMTDGGRPGFDAPFIPRGCDLRFYSTREICQILSRFESVIFLGDSLVRHLLGAFAMLLRENLEYGSQQQWRTDIDPYTNVLRDCTCDHQSFLFTCHKTDITSMRSVYDADPASVACPFLERPDLYFRSLTRWPLDPFELSVYINELVAAEKPGRPYAFIYGHGLWNELAWNDTLHWVDQVQQRLTEMRPYIGSTAKGAPRTLWPRLFVGPNAAGEMKQDGFLLTQGNKAIVRFEKFMRMAAPTKGMDFLGTWNMSVQGTIPDGSHSGSRTNLLKAMTIINWLDMLDLDEW